MEVGPFNLAHPVVDRVCRVAKDYSIGTVPIFYCLGSSRVNITDITFWHSSDTKDMPQVEWWHVCL